MKGLRWTALQNYRELIGMGMCQRWNIGNKSNTSNDTINRNNRTIVRIAYTSISLSISPSLSSSQCLSYCLSVYFFLFLFLSPLSQCIHLSIYLSNYRFIYIFVYLSIYLSIYLKNVMKFVSTPVKSHIQHVSCTRGCADGPAMWGNSVP